MAFGGWLRARGHRMALPLLLVAGVVGVTASRTAPPGILQQSPQRLERAFGPAVKVRPGAGRGERQVLFDPAPWHRIWPDLPEEAEFGISLGPKGEVGAVWLDVNAMVREARTGVSGEFRLGKAEAFSFFRGIFGRNPSRWREIPLPRGGGGHEGSGTIASAWIRTLRSRSSSTGSAGSGSGSLVIAAVGEHVGLALHRISRSCSWGCRRSFRTARPRSAPPRSCPCGAAPSRRTCW